MSGDCALPALEELARLRQWVCWRHEQRPGELKSTKIPLTVAGRMASSTAPDTWCSYTEARGAAQRGVGDGVGFVLTEHDPYVGVDLDGCISEKRISDFAMKVVRKIRSYTEVSPSGSGLRIFCRGSLPPAGRKRGDFEVYDSKRFLTVTGNLLPGTLDTIESRHDQVLALHREVFGEQAANGSSASMPYTTCYHGTLPSKVAALRTTRVLQLLETPGISLGYPSESEADLALAGMLYRMHVPPEDIDATLRYRREQVGGRRKDDQYFKRTIARASS